MFTTTLKYLENNILIMEPDVLEIIGFSRNEAKVYRALLEIGNGTGGDVSAKCGVNRSNTYDALDRLLQKGFVKYILNKKVKFFEPVNPKQLMMSLKEKETMLENEMPAMLLNYQLSTKEKEKVHTYKGARSFMMLANSFLDRKDKIYIFGSTAERRHGVNEFLENFHKRRTRKGIELVRIYDKKGKKRKDEMNNLAYTEARCILGNYKSPPITTYVCGNEVLMVHWLENPLIIRIESSTVASAHRGYFELLWSLAD